MSDSELGALGNRHRMLAMRRSESARSLEHLRNFRYLACRRDMRGTCRFIDTACIACTTGAAVKNLTRKLRRDQTRLSRAIRHLEARLMLPGIGGFRHSLLEGVDLGCET